MGIKKKFSAVVAAGLSLAMMVSLAACGGEDKTASTKDDGSLMTVDVYDDLANYQGIQKGWFAKLVKDKFNIKLNIIAPNVAGGSTVFDTRAASGDLGDIVITGAGSGRLSKLIKAKLIDDMTPYLDGMDNIKKYSGASDSLNELAGQKSGVWALPNSVSSKSPTEPSEGNEPTFGPYIRWDLYKEIGYPEIKDMDDFLQVLKKMQDKARADSGTKDIYALSLFKDWDGNMMNNAKQPTTYYGYDELGFVLAKADGSDFQSITEDGGQYEKALEFFNKADQMGLVDPESSTQNYDTMFSKYQNGKVLFSFWSYLGPQAYNTTDNKAAGKGFMIAPLEDMQIFSYGATPNGGSTIIALGSKAQNKQRLVKFIDWLYSAEGTYAMQGSVEGMNYEIKDGKPVLTDLGKKLRNDTSTAVPEEYGGGSYKDGVSALNFVTELGTDIDENTGEPYTSDMWSSVISEFNNSALEQDWSSHMGGAKTSMEYLKANDKLLVAPGSSYIQPDENSQITTLRGSIKTEIVNSSWKAVFAKNDGEFKKIFKSMQDTVNGLGIDQVLEVDMKNAKDQQAAREKVTKEYADRETSAE